MDGLVNFPTDIVWKGGEKKKKRFSSLTFHLAHGYYVHVSEMTSGTKRLGYETVKNRYEMTKTVF